MSEQAEETFPCKFKEVGCSEQLVKTKLSQHEMRCSYDLDNCLLKGCRWNGTKRALYQHFSEEHSENVLDSLSFILKPTEWDIIKTYKQDDDNTFYVFSITLESKDHALVVSSVNKEVEVVENCAIHWSTHEESLQTTTDSNKPFKLEDLMPKLPDLKVDVILPGVNKCKKCSGLCELRWAACKNKHAVCMNCMPKKHRYCFECEEELALAIDYKHKILPATLFRCLRISCYYLTDDLACLEDHEYRCVFSRNIYRNKHTSGASVKYIDLPQNQDFVLPIRKDSETYKICLVREQDGVRVSAICHHMAKPSFVTINMNGLCHKFVDPIPVTKTCTFEKIKYLKIAAEENTTFVFTIINFSF